MIEHLLLITWLTGIVLGVGCGLICVVCGFLWGSWWRARLFKMCCFECKVRMHNNRWRKEKEANGPISNMV
jgi:hypothetical protein